MNESSAQGNVKAVEGGPPPSYQPSGTPAVAQDGLAQLVHAIGDRIESIVTLITTIGERYIRLQEAKARYGVRMAWVAVSVVALVVVTAAVLTYLGRVDGATFTFLLGLIVGYMLTFIRDAVRSESGGDT